MRFPVFTRTIPALVLCLSFADCQHRRSDQTSISESTVPETTVAGIDESAPTAPTAPTAPRTDGQIRIHVRTPDGRSIPGARVRIGKGIARITGPNGIVRFRDIETGRHPVAVRAAGHAPGFQRIEIKAGETTFARVNLLKTHTTLIDGLDRRRTIKLGSMQLYIPANTMVDARGRPARGAKVQYVLLDPTTESARAMPGNYEGIAADGKEVALESIGAVSLDFFDSDTGAELNVARGRTIQLEMPVFGKARNDAPPIWSLDETKGIWVEEGRGKIARTSGRARTRFELPHLSWWNCDYPIIARGSIWIRAFEDETGRPLRTPELAAKGTDYNGISFGRSTNSGGRCLDVKPESRVSLEARYFDGRHFYELKHQMRSGVGGRSCLTDPRRGEVLPRVILKRIPTGCIRGRLDIKGTALSRVPVTVRVNYGRMPAGARQIPAAAGSVEPNGSFCIDNVLLARTASLEVLGPPRRMLESKDRFDAVRLPLDFSGGSEDASCVSVRAARGCADLGTVKLDAPGDRSRMRTR